MPEKPCAAQRERMPRTGRLRALVCGRAGGDCVCRGVRGGGGIWLAAATLSVRSTLQPRWYEVEHRRETLHQV